MSTPSCRYNPLTEEEKSDLKSSREDQLRLSFREAIVKDLLTIYIEPTPGSSPVDELMAGLDGALGIDRRKIFLEVLREALHTLEEATRGCDTTDSVQE